MQGYLCIVYFLHREAGDENKSEAEKNKVVSIMDPYRMGEYSPLSRAHIQAYAKITVRKYFRNILLKYFRNIFLSRAHIQANTELFLRNIEKYPGK